MAIWRLCDFNFSVCSIPSGGDGGGGGIVEWVFAPFQRSLHMASCLLCLFIASFWETLPSPRTQHKPKHLSVPSPEPLPREYCYSSPTSLHRLSLISHTSPPSSPSLPPPPAIPLTSTWAGHRFFFLFSLEHEGEM